MATRAPTTPSKTPFWAYNPAYIGWVDPDFDTDANDDELTGVGLDHLHQGNGMEPAHSL